MSDNDSPSPSPSDDRPGESGNKATKYDVWAYVIIGLLGIPIFALAVGALVLPPGIAFALVRRGLSEHKPAWTLLGALTGLLWLALLFASGRKIFRRPGLPGTLTPPNSDTKSDSSK